MGSAARVTSAAEGLPRRRFTVAEVEAMVAAGVMEEDERVELIGGNWFRCRRREDHHEVVKTALLRRWFRAAPVEIELTPETTFRLSEDTYLEPDVVIYPRASGLPGLTGANVLLVVEIADLSLRYDKRPQGGALRQFRHSRALGHRCGSTGRRGPSASRRPTAIGTCRTLALPTSSRRCLRRRPSRCGWRSSS